MNIIKLFNNNDMFQHIISYLKFNDKIILSKIIKKNCLKKYDLVEKDFHRNLDDIFNFYNDDNNDEFCEYLAELSSIFINEMDDYYNDYYNYNKEYYINDYYNNIEYDKHRELTDLFHSTYVFVYSRNLIEYIEDNNLPVIYYDYDIFDFDNKLDIDIHNQVIKYYKYIFQNEDISIFCEKCGEFGHYNGSKECILFNKYNENRIIKKKVKYSINNMIKIIIDNDKKEKDGLLLCIKCKINNKKNNCPNNSCGICCNKCIVHKR